MKVTVNGQAHDVSAKSLDALLVELGYGEAIVATAINSDFVPATAREASPINEGDKVEILAPMKGG